MKVRIMNQTRRKFMKDASVVGAVVIAAGTAEADKNTETSSEDDTSKRGKCPFFDQPLMCDGPDKNGKYKCSR